MFNAVDLKAILTSTWKTVTSYCSALPDTEIQTGHRSRPKKSSLWLISSPCPRLTCANAQESASKKIDYLSRYGVNAVVTGISVDIGRIRRWCMLLLKMTCSL